MRVSILRLIVLSSLLIGAKAAQAADRFDNQYLITAVRLDRGTSPDHMVHLIIGAALIVLVIFIGVTLRRPKS